ncbi:replication factor C large subunit [Candidatus Woesearchaeota archaeon]|nr:replication factor C large subunit [Candidatus Woesearchaeota archaeon]
MGGDFIPWIQKHSPKSESDLVGLDKAFSQMKSFVERHKPGKALLLYGLSGAGKTSSVYALAHSLGLELIEVNASDSRTADQIEAIVGTASKQMSLFSKGKIILVDEVEGVTGREDRGGLTALIKIISESRFPIILTCQDPFGQKHKALRKACTMIEFAPRPHSDVVSFLQHVCEGEGLSCDEDALSIVARRSNGDFRAALNDLQSVANSGKRVTRADVEFLSDREHVERIENALLRIFKTSDPGVARQALDSVAEDLDEIFLWVDENLPKEYLRPEDLARGFEQMSRADVFKGRIMRWQHYRFYVYCYDLLSAGIAVSKDERYKSQVDYKQTTRKLKIWLANMKQMKKKAICEKIAAKTHSSRKQALQATYPYVKSLFKGKGPGAAEGRSALSEFFEFDPEQVAYLER